MSDTQILTLAIAIVVPLALLLLSNSRLTDMRGSLQANIADIRRSLDDAKDTLRAEMRAQHVELLAEVRGTNAFLHDVLMPKLDDMDIRLTALEGKKEVADSPNARQLVI